MTTTRSTDRTHVACGGAITTFEAHGTTGHQCDRCRLSGNALATAAYSTPARPSPDALTRTTED